MNVGARTTKIDNSLEIKGNLLGEQIYELVNLIRHYSIDEDYICIRIKIKLW